MTCSVPSGPVILSGSTVMETVTITTSAPSAAHQNLALFLKHGLPLLGMCLGCVVITVRRRLWTTTVFLMILTTCFVLNSCGGGGAGGGGGGGGGTPPGTYNFTLTATSGSSQKTAALTVVVQ